jgi:hypothetical protein
VAADETPTAPAAVTPTAEAADARKIATPHIPMTSVEAAIARMETTAVEAAAAVESHRAGRYSRCKR